MQNLEQKFIGPAPEVNDVQFKGFRQAVNAKAAVLNRIQMPFLADHF